MAYFSHGNLCRGVTNCFDGRREIAFAISLRLVAAKQSIATLRNEESAMKKKFMLIVPMLHQGGFERVCVATARLLEPYYEVYIVIFSAMDIAYDIRGLHVIDIHMKSVEGKAGKVLNVFRRAKRVAALKEEYGIDIAYSFGPTANLVNVFSGMRPFRKGGAVRAKIWCGVRSYMDMGNPGLLRQIGRAHV